MLVHRGWERNKAVVCGRSNRIPGPRICDLVMQYYVVAKRRCIGYFETSTIILEHVGLLEDRLACKNSGSANSKYF